MEITWREAKDYCQKLYPGCDAMEFRDSTVYVVIERAGGEIMRIGHTPAFSDRLAWIEAAKHLDNVHRAHGRDDLRFIRKIPVTEIVAKWQYPEKCPDPYRLQAYFRLPDGELYGISLATDVDIRIPENANEKQHIEGQLSQRLRHDMDFVGYAYTLRFESELPSVPQS